MAYSKETELRVRQPMIEKESQTTKQQKESIQWKLNKTCTFILMMYGNIMTIEPKKAKRQLQNKDKHYVEENNKMN